MSGDHYAQETPNITSVSAMLTEPHFGTSRDLPLADPIMPTPMIVEIDRIDLYDRNPRRERNAVYADIRDSHSFPGRGSSPDHHTPTRRAELYDRSRRQHAAHDP